MSKQYNYDEESDSLFILVKEGKQESFEEIVPGVNVELDENGDLIGVEILQASRFSESVQRPAAAKG